MSPNRANLANLGESQNARFAKATVGSATTYIRSANLANLSILRTCAGATHGKGSREGVGEIREIREIRTETARALWAAFENQEDIQAIAGRLALPPNDPVDGWRLAVLRIARSSAFINAAPKDTPLTADDWQRWTALDASPRKMLSLLRKLIYGVRIWA